MSLIVQPLTAGSTDASTPAKRELDSQAFLMLLTTQLKAQDPLDPLKPNEFMAQLAQFSTLEELIRIRQDLEKSAGAAANAVPAATIPNSQ